MNKLIFGIVVVAMLIAFSAPASATCPCITIDTDTINGDIYYKTADVWPGTVAGGGYTASHTFVGVPAGVKIARVHTGVWDMGYDPTPVPGDPGVEITVNGVASGVRYPVNENCDAITDPDLQDYVTGFGPHFIAYDATAEVAGGGDITVTVESTNAKDGRIYTIALLVVYQDASMASMTYWINEGAWWTGDGPAVVNFNGPYPAGVTDVTYWTLGMPYGISTNPLLNDNDIGTWDYYEEGYYDFWRWDDIDTGLAPNNQMVHPVSGGDWQRVDAAVFRLRRGAPELPDLNGWDIMFQDEMEPGDPFDISVNVKNYGNAGTGGTFNVGLWIDGVFHNKVIGVGPLGPGENEIVNFMNIILPECCHNFTVIKDCDNDVVESDETNNIITEWHTVGHNHTVVRSNTELDEHSDFTLRDGTYYMEDLTIWNCAGCGITIENTTLPFVIDNCIVQNCGYDGNGAQIAPCSGICLKNVSNGKVVNSVIEHNTEHGISVLDYSTNVDITNCIIRDQSAGYGIEVGLVTLSGDEIPEFIDITFNELYNNFYGIELIGTDCTVKCNTVRDNGAYGIYVFGTANEIYNNTIKNNDDYGMKMYNSSSNDIYGNDFTDNNNGKGVQGWDNRVTNTWNSPTPVNYCYSGGTYISHIGNYWSDHTTPDTNGDGIVDIPYTLDGGAGAKDFYPAMVRWRLCGDVNRDGVVNMLDYDKLYDYVSGTGTICSTGVADVNCDGFVNMLDYDKLYDYVTCGTPLCCCCCGICICDICD